MLRRFPVVLLGLLVLLAIAAGLQLPKLLQDPEPAFAQTVQTAEMNVTFELDQATTDEQMLTIVLRSVDGTPVDTQAVQLGFAMRDMAMASSSVEMQPMGQGRFQARGSFFSMAGAWLVRATIARAPADSSTVQVEIVIPASGEVAGLVNPRASDKPSGAGGELVYQANCAMCHGPTARGDGPAGAQLNPPPANLVQHMLPGQHSDEQVFLWIKNGYPNSGMPAFGQTLTDDEIWSVVSYIRALAQNSPDPNAVPSSTGSPSIPNSSAAVPALPPIPDEPASLPPGVYVQGSQLWYRNEDQQLQPLTAAPPAGTSYGIYTPVYAPDYRSIAYIVVNYDDGTNSLNVVNADGTNMRSLWQTHTVLNSPTWSPDGETIYLTSAGWEAADTESERTAIHIARVDVGRGAVQSILTNAVSPSVSPNGTELVYLGLSTDGKAVITFAALDGDDPRQILTTNQFIDIQWVQFSPDGTEVLFAAADGSEYTPSEPSSSLPWLGPSLGIFNPPVVEAHGSLLDLWIVKTDGSDLRRLVEISSFAPAATYSPDGTQLLIGDSNGFYLANADGSNLRRISPVGSDENGFDWSPSR